MLFSIIHEHGEINYQTTGYSFEQTIAFSYILAGIKELYPQKTDGQIEQALAACYAKMQMPIIKSQFLRLFIQEIGD